MYNWSIWLENLYHNPLPVCLSVRYINDFPHFPDFAIFPIFAIFSNFSHYNPKGEQAAEGGSYASDFETTNLIKYY